MAHKNSTEKNYSNVLKQFEVPRLHLMSKVKTLKSLCLGTHTENMYVNFY